MSCNTHNYWWMSSPTQWATLYITPDSDFNHSFSSNGFDIPYSYTIGLLYIPCTDNYMMLSVAWRMLENFDKNKPEESSLITSKPRARFSLVLSLAEKLIICHLFVVSTEFTVNRPIRLRESQSSSSDTLPLVTSLWRMTRRREVPMLNRWTGFCAATIQAGKVFQLLRQKWRASVT